MKNKLVSFLAPAFLTLSLSALTAVAKDQRPSPSLPVAKGVSITIVNYNPKTCMFKAYSTDFPGEGDYYFSWTHLRAVVDIQAIKQANLQKRNLKKDPVIFPLENGPLVNYDEEFNWKPCEKI